MTQKAPYPYYVYILGSAAGAPVYIDVTRSLSRAKIAQRHPRRLLRAEGFNDLAAAILRAEDLRRWRSAWTHALIAKDNPGWRDIAAEAKLAA